MDVINQMEHPLIAELRQQMEQQEENYKREIEEIQEELQDKTGQIEDMEWVHGKQIDLISDIKDKYSERDEDGELIEKFTLENLLQDLSSVVSENYYDSNMLKELNEALNSLEIYYQEPEIVYQDKEVIPKNLKQEIINLIDKY